jgi:hypothetical protein
MKQFGTALDKESAAFEYLRDFFPKLPEAKFKAGVFVGPQIKKILECKEFPKMLTTKEKAAWNVGLPRQSQRPKTMWSCIRLW